MQPAFSCLYFPRHRNHNHLPVQAWKTSWYLVIYTTWVIIVMCLQRQSEVRNFLRGQTIPVASYTFILSLSPFVSEETPTGRKQFLTFGRSSAGKLCTKKKKKNVPHASHPSICESCLLPCASKYPLTSTVLSIKTIVTSWWHHNYKMIRIFMAKPCVQKQQNSAIIQKYEMLLQFPWLLFRRQDNSALTGLYTTEGWEEKSVTLDCRK